MIDDSHRSHTPLRRALMIAASVTVASFAWVLVGESEKAVAEEPASTETAGVLATVGGEAITEAEVREAAAAQLMQAERQKYDAISGALDGMIRQKMLELEAAERGVSVEDMMKAEVADKASEVAEADVDAFWTENGSRIRGTKEQLAEQIRGHLAQEKFLAFLKEKYTVTKNLEPYRIEVAAVGPSKGPADAPVTIIEFSDFECPFCSRVNPTMDKVMETYGDKVRVVFRQFPLAMHPNAPKAGEASLCAHDQGKFWEMHDAMFADQRGLGVSALKTKAAAIEGVDTEAFDECLDSGKYADQVQADLREGSAAGVSGTPAFFINGRFLNGAQPFEAFEEIIEDELGS